MRKSKFLNIIFLTLSLVLTSMGSINGTNTASPGSKPIGSTNYGINGDIFVNSSTGNDENSGTALSPLKTVKKALSKIAPNETIVLYGGIYHESRLFLVKPGVTIKSYPGQAVWFDGSTVINEWNKVGDIWVHNNWTYKFDSSPLDKKGAPDGTEKGWQNININYPMASHPDGVWINDRPQQQVNSISKVSANSFYVDEINNKLYIGSDPTQNTVRASDLGSRPSLTENNYGSALIVTASNCSILGIGFRRYATSIPDVGTVYLNQGASNTLIENVELCYNAAVGLGINGYNVTLRNVSAHDNGLGGLGANRANNLILDKVSVTKNNTEKFNTTPMAAGMKICHEVNTKISNSKFSDNYATGLWFDEDCYNVTLTSNEFSNNSHYGLVYELSAKAIIANNEFINNTDAGIAISSSNDVGVWNNYIVGGKVALGVTQQNRFPKDAKYGRTWKVSEGLPNLTWIVKDIVISNNILGNSTDSILQIYDQVKQNTLNSMITSNGNVYLCDLNPKNTVEITGINSYISLDEFKKSTKQDSRSIEIKGGLNGLQKEVQAVAVNIPSNIAQVSGLPSNKLILGPIGYVGGSTSSNMGTLRGNLDKVTNNVITGWVWDSLNPNKAMNVKIVIMDSKNNKKAEYTVLANEFRQDVKNSGFGTGNYGFTYNMNWSKFSKDTYKVTGYAVVNGNTIELSNPKTYVVK